MKMLDFIIEHVNKMIMLVKEVVAHDNLIPNK